MTELVVVDKENKVVVSETATEIVVTSTSADDIIVWGQMGPPGLTGPAGPPGPQGPTGVTTISQASDVDITQVVTGSILVYNTQQQKWIATASEPGDVDSVDGNTGAISAEQLLIAIKKVDGVNSGLDADLVKGLSTSSSATASTVVTRDNNAASQFNAVLFNEQAIVTTPITGTLWWNSESNAETLNIAFDHDIVHHVGQELYYRVKANTQITKGQVVMSVGTVGNSGTLLAQPAANLTPQTGIYVIGVAAHNIPQGDFGYITKFGLIRGVNTQNFAENWTEGTVLYLDPTVAGGLTKYIHTAPSPRVTVAIVVTAAQNGNLFVRVTHGSVLGATDGNVEFVNLADGDQIVYNQQLARWENKPSTGNGLDQTLAITKNLTITTDWQDTGIVGTDLATGTYLIQLFANDLAAGGVNNNEYYSGTMSWYSGATNSSVELPTDEIVLHRAGATSDAGMYLRTYRAPNNGSLRLQIYSNVANPSASNYVFKFRRMI